MAIRPGRIMAYMLLMSAFKIGDPIGRFIQMIIYNLTADPCHLCLQRSHKSGLSTLFPTSSHLQDSSKPRHLKEPSVRRCP